MTDELDRMVYARVAAIIEAQCLDLKALGKGRRGVLERTVAQLNRAALEGPEAAFAGERFLPHSLKRLRETR